MKNLNKIFSSKQLTKILHESNNLDFALTHLYSLCEQFPSHSDSQIADTFSKTYDSILNYKQHEKIVCEQVQKLYEESAPTNVTAGIDASTPRIIPKEKKNVIHRNKKNQEAVQ